VQVCSPRPWPEAIKDRIRGKVIEPGADVESAGLRAVYPIYWYTPWLSRNRSGALLWNSCRRSVDSLVQNARPDVVLSYWAHPDGEAGLKAARRHGAAAAVIVGGTDALILPHRPGRGPHVRRVLTESDAVLTVSEGLRAAVIELGANPERVHVMYQGVQPEVFHPRGRDESRAKLNINSSRPVLVWIGRMVGLKRLDVLIDACERLRSQHFDFELHLVGDGETRGRMQKRVRDAGLSEVVKFVGSVPYHETADWYRAADATVLCSDSEGLPNVLRESLACGSPFVSTDVGSIREIASDDLCVLTPRGDAAALAEGIRTVLSDSYRTAAARFRPRTWADCAAGVVDVLESIRGVSPATFAPTEEVLT
jgi:glycosyltransferase involved in cell wall biosynthesis